MPNVSGPAADSVRLEGIVWMLLSVACFKGSMLIVRGLSWLTPARAIVATRRRP